MIPYIIFSYPVRIVGRLSLLSPYSNNDTHTQKSSRIQPFVPQRTPDTVLATFYTPNNIPFTFIYIYEMLDRPSATMVRLFRRIGVEFT